MESSDIAQRISRIRGHQVMMSQDLSALYGVSVGALNQAVKRNLSRFPPDFMFQLSVPELQNLKSQIVISSWGGVRARPFAFTEHGIAMLSAVLRSPQAIQVSLAIIRAFIKLRRAVLAQKDIGLKVERLEGRVSLHDTDIRFLREDMRKLKSPPHHSGPRVKGFENT